MRFKKDGDEQRDAIADGREWATGVIWIYKYSTVSFMQPTTLYTKVEGIIDGLSSRQTKIIKNRVVVMIGMTPEEKQIVVDYFAGRSIGFDGGSNFCFGAQCLA